MNKSTRGFTIVELLIVIVVIAVLAAISIVAYNGIQTRAENAKTLQAVATWVKAMQVYKVDKGNYPITNSCLGRIDTYAGSHSGRCWDNDTNSTWVVQQDFLDEMKDYVKTYPSPSEKDINANAGGNQYRGALYYRHTGYGAERIYVEIIGATGQNDCPTIGGLGSSWSGTQRTNGRSCYYSLPQ